MPTVITGTDGINQVQAGAVESGDLPAGSVIQVVHTNKTDTQVISTTSYTEVMSLTITPTNTSSKFLVIPNIAMGVDDQFALFSWRIARNGDNSIFIADSSSRHQSTGGTFSDGFGANLYTGVSNSTTFLDEPNSVSELTYSVEARSSNGSRPIYINRGSNTTNIGDRGVTTSSLTVMEIAG